MLASIIIRTFNEEKHLADLLKKIDEQECISCELETLVVDSGSTDRTLDIANQYGARIIRIEKSEFTFGRSLNFGCREAHGDFLVFISGHCIPANNSWIDELIAPLLSGEAAYTYGKQIGNSDSRFSECQLFRKYYPDNAQTPQTGFFCNNANAALLASAWKEQPFDEDLTGLEDMDLAKRLVNKNMSIGYTGNAAVYHLHDESWHKVKVRYQREAIALRHIMPEIHVTFRDFLRYYFSALLLDFGAAIGERQLGRKFVEISLFRLMQYWGTYRGNHEHRKMSARLKEEYFYPK